MQHRQTWKVTGGIIHVARKRVPATRLAIWYQNMLFELVLHKILRRSVENYLGLLKLVCDASAYHAT